MTEAATMLSMRGVGKRYGAVDVVRDVDLELRHGERVVVCGPSGSGKSTMLACITGLVRHERGRIAVDGVELDHDAGTVPELRRKVGMVFQSFNLFPHLTVLENCVVGPMLVRRETRREAEARPAATRGDRPRAVPQAAADAVRRADLVARPGTHEMGFAREAADRIAFMDEGLVVEIAPPADFFSGAAHSRVRDFLARVLGRIGG